MADRFAMGPNGFFKASVARLCQLNELTSFLNPWVITPLGSRIATNKDLHPAITALIYAILEPSLTIGIHYIAIPPWFVLLWAGPLHLCICWTHMDISQALRLREERSVSFAGSMENQKSTPNRIRGPSSRFLMLLGPLLTAAVSNAALVLFTQSFQAPSRLHQHPNVRILEIFAVFLFLGCRFADFDIWRRTERSGIFKKWRSVIVPLYCQALSFALRALLRWAFGVSPLLGLQTLSTDEAEEMFELSRYGWIKENWKLPAWLNLVGPVLAFVGAFSSTSFLQRVMKEST